MATAPTEIYTLSLHDALPISLWMGEAGILLVAHRLAPAAWQEERLLACIRANAANPTWELMWGSPGTMRSEEHTSELQSHSDLVCRLLLEKKKKNRAQTAKRK